MLAARPGVSSAVAAEILAGRDAVLAGLIADAGPMRIDRSGLSPFARASAHLAVRADRDDFRFLIPVHFSVPVDSEAIPRSRTRSRGESGPAAPAHARVCESPTPWPGPCRGTACRPR